MSTAQKKWIFRFKGSPTENEGSRLLTVLKEHSLKIIDNGLPRMLLVLGTHEEVDLAKSKVDSNWTVAEENSSYSIPDTKKKIRK